VVGYEGYIFGDFEILVGLCIVLNIGARLVIAYN